MEGQIDVTICYKLMTYQKRYPEIPGESAKDRKKRLTKHWRKTHPEAWNVIRRRSNRKRRIAKIIASGREYKPRIKRQPAKQYLNKRVHRIKDD